MTVEELEIIVTAKVEEAVKQFKKIVPEIKKTVQQAQESFEKMDTKEVKNKIQQAVQFVKKKIQDLKKSNKNNEIKLTVNNKEAQKQISQIQKEIDSLQQKMNARQMKLNITNNALDKMRSETNQEVIKDMPNAGNKVIKQETYNRLNSNAQYTSLVKESDKLNNEAIKYNSLLEMAKQEMSSLGNETQKTSTTQNKLSSFFGAFKGKLEQVKGVISSIRNVFSKIPNITKYIANHIKGMGNGLKSGLGHVLKYATALFGLRTIYNTLQQCASSWLSSQNEGAQQLSSNIEYLKYSMGSVFAPIIEYIINLVYQLMKAIQSVVYAFSGINIFAKATVSSMNKTAGSAKQASKTLAGVHGEINNVSENDNSSGSGSISPSMDLSQLDSTPNSIIEAIKNGDWYQIGAAIGEMLNNAMNSIPWNTIQNGARNIATGIAKTLNGFIKTTDWQLVGNTFAQGLNTIIYFAYKFVTTFDWKQFGTAIGTSINSFIHNIDWAKVGQTISEGIKGIFNAITNAIQEIDWKQVGQDIKTFLINIDWAGIVESIFSTIGSALGGLAGFLIGLLGDAWQDIKDYFKSWIDDAHSHGENTVGGILEGICNALVNIGNWIYEHMIKPIVDAFCNMLGIHSPSTVFAEFGKYIIEGLFNGISGLVDNISQIWENIKNTAMEKFNSIKTSISDIWQKVKESTSETWENIKNKVKVGVLGAWNAITSVFGNIGNWFHDKFSQAWQAVKNIFSTGGAIFDGIKDGILNGLKTVINAIINGINKVIAIPFNGLNTALRKIRDLSIAGISPFSWIATISVPQIPQLAKGGVLTQPTTVLAGEYSGARSNPEIVTPQNIMYDTMRRAIEDTEFHNGNSGQTIHLTVNVSNKKLGQILLDDLRDIKRISGKGIEALVGG